ncbi:GumC family protein [Brumimicrobium mesophilum]|uniref:GumC family protein n=1 Tax=Brumimicrobium mesophilum TaxID=392717 RepID=UPI000D142E6F|nr:polysaccharide biosynthesis tyrosine autokinase [Brumimicrobium mesophilum]
MQQQIFEQQTDDNVNFQETVGKYLQHWKWIVAITILFVGIAFLYLKGEPSIYQSTSTVLVKDDKRGGLVTDIDLFAELGGSRGYSNLYNEIEVFKSRDLVKKVVQSLQLNTQITKTGGPLSANTYYYTDDSPFKFNFIDSTVDHYTRNYSIDISQVNNETFVAHQNFNENGSLVNKLLGEFKFNQAFETIGGKINVSKTENFGDIHKGEHFNFKVSTLESATNRWKSKFEVTPSISKEASVLTLSAQGLMKQANNDFLNQIIVIHEQNAIADKNEITKNTSEFIAERMIILSEELSKVEGVNEKFKTDNQLVDVEKNASIILQQESIIEDRIIQSNIQLSMSEYLKEYLEKNSDNTTLLPSNLGFSDLSINQMSSDYNKLILDRNKIITNSSKNNPIAIQLESQINSVKNSLTQSLNNSKRSLQLELKELKKESRKYNSRLSDIPEMERRYREILRQQNLKETLYLYLLEKREENEIAMASTIGNVKTIDVAYANSKPVGPKREIIFISALILGLLVPILFIYIRDLIDNKIRSVEELEATEISVVGDIPLNKTKDNLVTKKGERTIISEAYRMVRTNMKFLLENKADIGNVIFLSSTLPSEGKSFTSINLANSLSLTNKKVVLVGLDLRAPKLSEYLNHEETLLGVSNYLANSDIDLDSIIYPGSGDINFDYIFSGDIPPNPSELLTRPRLTDLFAELKTKYDYIIVDTSPMALVVDTISILDHADLLLYVVKADFAHKNSLNLPLNLKREKKVGNIAFIFNGSNRKKAGYGYGKYGYGYGQTYGSNQEEKKWYQFFKR